MSIEAQVENKRAKRVKLVFNPVSGAVNASPVQLMDVIGQMQSWKLMPEVFLLEPECDLQAMAMEALGRGIHLFVACGGDGTVSAVAKAVAGLPATLGIIPTGTQNNIALSLGIPEDIPVSIAMLRMGRRIKIDMGLVTRDDVRTPFVELCSVGLISSLFSSGDEIRHGHLERVGDFLSTLVTSAPSDIRLWLDDGRHICETGHTVLVSNMPYVGRHLRVGHQRAFQDGYLDVLLFADLSKLNLLGCVLKGTDVQKSQDPRIRSFRARRIDIDADPAMPVMVDGISLGEGSLRVEAHRRALAVMAPPEPRAGVQSAGASGREG